MFGDGEMGGAGQGSIDTNRIESEHGVCSEIQPPQLRLLTLVISLPLAVGRAAEAVHRTAECGQGEPSQADRRQSAGEGDLVDRAVFRPSLVA